MCLEIKKPIIGKRYSKDEVLNLFKTARKNITVYKRFEVRGYKNYTFIHLRSPYRNARYYLGQKYESDISFNSYLWNTISINKGLHSYVHKKRTPIHYDEVIIPCIIPKGAKYLKGINGDIVSNKLVLPDSFIYKGEEYNINY